ncbi:FtsW/RodA/SpoVE family cell cycle protein [Arcobacter sp. FWKO B]|uniref:FtsW/RodA/SpoVE family cell cycle protein n=1 Tax=Arcobacter sp. FWKO B TaxID=2593672 RepID=UPI0018A5A5D5|nr:FtsW/RodA/SpoVE family cell cycle protein [Arcobacter sp. FWKO B]QOG11173.1 rod shape-determining protein RodA [Arcobacter sp. FWKO B]
MQFFDKRIISHFDFVTVMLVIPIILLSYHLINEINDILGSKQLIYFMIAIAGFLIVFYLPIRRWIKIIPILYWLGIILLLLVEFIGVTKLGAKRWIEIPIIGLTIQPSELIKPIYLLMLGYLVMQKPPQRDGYEIKDFAIFSFYILLPTLLIAKEPDLGTAAVLALVGFGVLFVVGVRIKIWIGISIVIAILSPLAYTYLIKDYQKKRIADFISEEPSYHVRQSIIAIGSGGLFGKSVDDATQAQLKFLPIATSDFIFAYLIERYGFIGGLGLILIYFLLIVHLFYYNYYFSEDYLLKVFSTGLALLIFLNMSVNILMVIGFAPVVGLPLPLFSYGGSSFINYVILIAIFENLVAFRYKDSYNFERRLY